MFNKKECVAMLLAGGQGSRLYVLTQHKMCIRDSNNGDDVPVNAASKDPQQKNVDNDHNRRVLNAGVSEQLYHALSTDKLGAQTV